MFRWVRRSTLILLLAVTSFFFIDHVKALVIPNDNEKCADVLLIFARGSGQNQDHRLINDPFDENFKDREHESYEFFHRVQYLLDQYYPNVTYKAHSVHDFPDKYNTYGYSAVNVGWQTGPSLLNSIQAEFTWSPLGDYQDSVQNGIEEFTGFVKDELARCPGQRIVVGGYSQGAQVVGDSLFQLTSEERERIGGVALFGDPKFVGTDGNPLNPFSTFEPYPWKRGTAKKRDRGLADARIPYVPNGMEQKVLSWCFEDDFVCSGYSGIRSIKLSEIGAGHGRYPDFGIPQAASEVVQWIAPELYALNKNRGGLDKGLGPVQPIPHQPNPTPIDLMFLVNTSAGLNDVLGTLRATTDDIIPPLKGFFSNVHYAVGDFNENAFATSTGFLPRTALRQDFKPYGIQPGNLGWTFYRDLANGGLSGGGGDTPDPHILAVERMSMLPNWRQDAAKHLVLITERPAKDPHTYDICDGAVRSNNGLPNPSGCHSGNPNADQQPSSLHPELCETIQEALSQDICQLDHRGTGLQHKITRTLEDAVTVAQAKGIALTIVVPHPMQHQMNVAQTKQQLEYFAKATGGLYIEYNVFNRASYSDMVWQVLNHTPKQLRLAYHDATETLATTESLQPKTKVLSKAGVPTLLDVSQSSETYDTYKWDFDGDGDWDETTSAPNTEHIFKHSSDNGFLKVAGLNSSSKVEAELVLPLTVQPYNGPTFTDVVVPKLPENIKAMKDSDGVLQLTWENGQPGEVFMVGDPTTGMPAYSAPADQNSLSFSYPTEETSIIVWILGKTASSPRQNILVVEQEIHLPEEKLTSETDTLAEEPNKTGLGESNPWLQFLQNPPVTDQPQLAQSNNQSAVTLPVTHAVVTTFLDGEVKPDVLPLTPPNEQGQVLAQTNSIQPSSTGETFAKQSYYLFILLVLSFGIIGVFVLHKVYLAKDN